eukprot:14151958-Alexandrium_andersonii.AAC.1
MSKRASRAARIPRRRRRRPRAKPRHAGVAAPADARKWQPPPLSPALTTRPRPWLSWRGNWIHGARAGSGGS